MQVPWVVEFKLPKVPDPIRAQFETKLVIGRSDKASAPPDVDLKPFNAEDHGISRHHAALLAEGSQLKIMDLGSGNGTYVNGVRLTPNEPVPLVRRDHVQLAKLPITLRVVVAPSYAAGFHEALDSDPLKAPMRGGGKTILIVKKDADVAQVIAETLRQVEFKPVIARSVVSAIRLFNQKSPSLILLDLTLPDMPGAELCRYVRRDTHHSGTPLIALQTSDSDVTTHDAIEAGADIVLSEPLSMKELTHVVFMLVGEGSEGVATLRTKRLLGTAPLQTIQPQSRRNSVVMFVAGHKEPLVLTAKEAITFGRSVSQNLQSHVDLSRYNAVDNGVSRLHARLSLKDGSFFLEDLNSVNGTFLNGEPLKPETPVPLRSADEVRFGRMRFYIYFLESADKSE